MLTNFRELVSTYLSINHFTPSKLIFGCFNGHEINIIGFILSEFISLFQFTAFRKICFHYLSLIASVL